MTDAAQRPGPSRPPPRPAAAPTAPTRAGQWLGRAPDAPDLSDNGPTINVIHQVWRARQLRPAWSASLASVVAWTACLHRDLTIDRDHDAGEAWITLLRDRTPWATSAPTCPCSCARGPWRGRAGRSRSLS